MRMTIGGTLGPYKILAPLGAGGMGAVYLAEDPRLGRRVAIKMLPDEFASDSDRLRRFEQEARATSALNHPNILTVYDIGAHEGAPYIVAELLEGEELSELIKQGAIAPRKAVDFARQIAEGLAGGGAWNRAGDIIIAPNNGGALYRVPATGGVPTQLTTTEPSRYAHWVPQFLPDGDHFLFYANGKQPGASGVYAGSLSDKATNQVVSSDYMAVYAAGYLLFVRNGELMGQSFDTGALKLVGEPFLVTEQVKTFFMVPQISAAESGTLAFQSGVAQKPQLVWFDRSGKQLRTVGEPDDYSNPSLSAGDKRLAVGILDPKTMRRDIWLFDLARGARSRFTSDPGDDTNPVWSIDGSRIFFTSNRKGPRDIFQKKVDAAEDEELIHASPDFKNVEDISPDGRLLIYNTNDATGVDLWLLPLEGERIPKPFLKTK